MVGMGREVCGVCRVVVNLLICLIESFFFLLTAFICTFGVHTDGFVIFRIQYKFMSNYPATFSYNYIASTDQILQGDDIT